MTIVIVPPYPQRNDPNFATVADSWNAQLPTWTSQVNAAAISISQDAATATIQAGLATTNGAAQVALAANQVTLAANQVSLATAQASLATTQAQNAYNSASQAAATANVIKWISGTTYTEGQNVWSPITSLTYRRKSTGAGTTDPSIDTTNWQSLIASYDMVLLSSAIADGVASIEFDVSNNDYFEYILKINDLFTSSSSNSNLQCQVKVDGSWITNEDSYVGRRILAQGDIIASYLTTPGCTLALPVTSFSHVNANISILNGSYPTLSFESINYTDGSYIKHWTRYTVNTNPIESIRIIPTAYLIQGGILNLYGIKK